jgi:hypothetical protein
MPALVNILENKVLGPEYRRGFRKGFNKGFRIGA